MLGVEQHSCVENEDRRGAVRLDHKTPRTTLAVRDNQIEVFLLIRREHRKTPNYGFVTEPLETLT